MSGKILQPPIGILGGTFDPVHIGHLRLALEAYERLNLSCVRLIPLNHPNHRATPTVSPELRLEMLVSSVDGKRLIADDRELARSGVSYTVETLESLKRDYTHNPLCFLMGADAFQNLCTWHRWDELLNSCHLIVVTRPDSETSLEPRLEDLVTRSEVTDPKRLANELCGRIFFLSIPLLPISSTDIRIRIESNRDISHLVPSSVQAIIQRHHFYQSPTSYEC